MKRLLVLLLLAPLLAQAQTVTAPLVRPQLIFQSTVLTGNGADTTEDTLYTVSIPNQLQNVGDVIHVVARGVMTAVTDTRSIRLKLIGQVPCVFNSTLVGNTTWLMEAWIMKTGANAQSTMCIETNAANSVVNALAATTAAEASLTLSLTAQNQTTATANSIQVQQMIAWYLPGT